MEVPYSTGKFPTTLLFDGNEAQDWSQAPIASSHGPPTSPNCGDTSHGDGKHNKLFRNEFDSHRLLLHASELRFVHPFTNEELVMKASIDDTWQQLFTRFEWDEELVK